MSLLPPQEDLQYGYFGYKGAMCDRAIRADNPEMLQECIDKGWVDADNEVLGFGNIVDFCVARGFMKCADLLRSTKR